MQQAGGVQPGEAGADSGNWSAALEWSDPHVSDKQGSVI